jgi:hypothetical protein
MPKRRLEHSIDTSLKCGDGHVKRNISCHHSQRKRRKQKRAAGEANAVKGIRNTKNHLMGFNLRETQESPDSIVSGRTPAIMPAIKSPCLTDAAVNLFLEIESFEPSKSTFNDQALAIFKSLKGIRTKGWWFNFKHAKEVYILKRNPRAQIYFCKDLHNHYHGTIGMSTASELQNVRSGVEVIDSSENFFSNDLAVLNKSELLAKMAYIMKDMAPGFTKAIRSRIKKGDKRGTLSCHLGYTTTDAGQYSKVRLFSFIAC